MSRTPHAFFALLAALAVAVSSPAVARTRVHKVSAHRTPPPAVIKPIANSAAVSTNAAAIARQFDHWLDAIESSDDVAGLAVAVVKDDHVLLERGIGYANWATREPVSANTAFRLASLSKAFATALSAILVQDGVIGWDTRISNVLPTFTLADESSGQRLTVRDILSHRVGLPHNTYDRLLEQDEPYEVLVDRLKDVPRPARPAIATGIRTSLSV